MTRIATTLVGACLLAAPASAEERPLPLHQPFKLDTKTGCFDYTGTAAVFDGQFKRGAYVSVTMDDPDRIPAMDAPEYKTSEPGFWFGPLPKTGSYSIMFMPSYLHATPGTVLICGRTFAPGSREEAVHRDKVVDDVMANDPYSRALLKEPKTLAVHPDADSPQADVCGFAVRDVTMQAGEGADASPLQPRIAGSIKHYANLYESPFDVFAVCTPAEAGQPAKTVKLPGNTKDCYVAGGRVECSYLTPNEIVPAE